VRVNGGRAEEARHGGGLDRVMGGGFRDGGSALCARSSFAFGMVSGSVGETHSQNARLRVGARIVRIGGCGS
jgi:hypothetical protein